MKITSWIEITGMAQMPPLKIKLVMPVSLSVVVAYVSVLQLLPTLCGCTQTLMERLAIRLSCQETAAKSLVISRRGERSEGAKPDKRTLARVSR